MQDMNEEEGLDDEHKIKYGVLIDDGDEVREE